MIAILFFVQRKRYVYLVHTSSLYAAIYLICLGQYPCIGISVCRVSFSYCIVHLATVLDLSRLNRSRTRFDPLTFRLGNTLRNAFGAIFCNWESLPNSIWSNCLHKAKHSLGISLTVLGIAIDVRPDVSNAFCPKVSSCVPFSNMTVFSCRHA